MRDIYDTTGIYSSPTFTSRPAVRIFSISSGFICLSSASLSTKLKGNDFRFFYFYRIGISISFVYLFQGVLYLAFQCRQFRP